MTIPIEEPFADITNCIFLISEYRDRNIYQPAKPPIPTLNLKLCG